MSRGPFLYLADRLCCAALLLYCLNRYLLKPHFKWPFLHNHFNDLLLIPVALPVVLWIQRFVRLRDSDDFPTWQEMIFHWAVWSLICEGIGPLWLKFGTPDIWDVFCYGIGGIAACLWWKCNAATAKALS
jgi:hypothetical protein